MYTPLHRGPGATVRLARGCEAHRRPGPRHLRCRPGSRDRRSGVRGPVPVGGGECGSTGPRRPRTRYASGFHVSVRVGVRGAPPPVAERPAASARGRSFGVRGVLFGVTPSGRNDGRGSRSFVGDSGLSGFSASGWSCPRLVRVFGGPRPCHRFGVCKCDVDGRFPATGPTGRGRCCLVVLLRGRLRAASTASARVGGSVRCRVMGCGCRASLQFRQLPVPVSLAVCSTARSAAAPPVSAGSVPHGVFP